MTAILRTQDGITHGVRKNLRSTMMETACGLTFASWTYWGRRQGRRNRRRSMAHIPEAMTGDVDCMSCLVKEARS